MKEKNRFSVLLEHLTSMANLKNYVLAKAVQYDESYISKWISGKLLPTEKNHETILQNISQCIVDSLTDDNVRTFLDEYQVPDISDLQPAIYDHLESEYSYVKELQTTTGAEVATKISYYPELTLDQFIFKMKHPALRKVQSLNVYAMVDILNVDTNYQLLIAEFNSMHNDRGLVLPGVHFSLMIDLESTSLDPIYTAGFLMNLLSNLSNIDFNLYCGTQAQRKMVFAIKDIYSLSGMLVDQSHCLAVTTIEDSSLSTELYYKLRLLCSKEALLIRRSSIPEMIRTYEYEHSLFAQSPACLCGHFTEHFLPSDLHRELVDKYVSEIGKINRTVLEKMHAITAQILAATPVRALIYVSVFTDFTVTGELDFYGHRIHLTPDQRLRYLKHLKHLHEISDSLQLKILPNGLLSDYQHIPRPTLFLADDFSYLRLKKNTADYNICIPNKIILNRIFTEFYNTTWESDACIAPDACLTHAIHSVEILKAESVITPHQPRLDDY